MGWRKSASVVCRLVSEGSATPSEDCEAASGSAPSSVGSVSGSSAVGSMSGRRSALIHPASSFLAQNIAVYTKQINDIAPIELVVIIIIELQVRLRLILKVNLVIHYKMYVCVFRILNCPG